MHRAANSARLVIHWTVLGEGMPWILQLINTLLAVVVDEIYKWPFHQAAPWPGRSPPIWDSRAAWLLGHGPDRERLCPIPPKTRLVVPAAGSVVSTHPSAVSSLRVCSATWTCLAWNSPFRGPPVSGDWMTQGLFWPNMGLFWWAPIDFGAPHGFVKDLWDLH